MKLSKLLVSCVAVGALAAACTTAAFAADGVTAAYKDGKVTISGFQTYAGAVSGDLTLLILSEDTTVTSDNANNIIKQIDQFGKDTVTVADDGTYSKEITVGTLDTTKPYYVRLGGAEVSDIYKNGFVATTFGGSNNPYADSTRLIGDVDNSGGVGVADVVGIKLHVVGNEILTGESLQAADCDDSGSVGAGDVMAVKLNIVDSEQNPFSVKMVKDKTNYVPETAATDE